MKYHVHVYTVSEKHEIDLEADTPEEAKLQAMIDTKAGKAKKVGADCKYIAMEFLVDTGIGGGVPRSNSIEGRYPPIMDDEKQLPGPFSGSEG